MPKFNGVFTTSQAGLAKGQSNWPDQVYIPELLIVGGGGAGGGNYGISSGGGAGGILLGVNLYLARGTYTITVGAGGTGGNNTSQTTPTSGSDSVFGPYTAKGGGVGTGYGGDGRGISGGSGGGCASDLRNGAPIGGFNYCPGYGVSTQVNPNPQNFTVFGNRGGRSAGTSNTGVILCGGGGGAGTNGYDGQINGNLTQGNGGDGGAGYYFTTSGASVAYGGGGGGSGYNQNSNGAGGVGGGGTPAGTAAGAAGTANTGGGGGGTSYVNWTNGAGGSGIVCMKLLSTFAPTSTTGSPTTTTAGGFTYYKWTGSGSVTF